MQKNTDEIIQMQEQRIEELQCQGYNQEDAFFLSALELKYTPEQAVHILELIKREHYTLKEAKRIIELMTLGNHEKTRLQCKKSFVDSI